MQIYEQSRARFEAPTELYLLWLEAIKVEKLEPLQKIEIKTIEFSLWKDKDEILFT